MKINKTDNRAKASEQNGTVTSAGRGLSLHAARHRRDGWEKQFVAMAQAGDDALLDDTVLTSHWDEHEWTW